ncbi:MAG: YccF domain-containing protein [Deltaproteobacteria bacterium]|nr:YccF domain-containing protein [Deltaproteobacteria bacterium]
MRTLLNVLWAIVGGGLITALEYVLGGLVLCLTVVGIPFGVQCFKLAGLALFPFGKEVVEDPTSAGGGALGLVMNVLWFLVAGIWTCITHLGLALGLAVTIIGIPFALQHLKLAVLALFPFGRRVVESA